MVEKYKLLKDFLTKDETDIYKRYCIIQHRIGTPRPNDSQVPFATSTYGDPAMEALMLNKKVKLQNIVNLKLLPTYAYWRMYMWDNDLKVHQDRPSCEISLTVHFGSDNTHEWPIYMGDKALDLKIDIRTNIGLLKRKIDDIEKFRSQTNNDLYKHISSLSNLLSDLQNFEKELMTFLDETKEKNT